MDIATIIGLVTAIGLVLTAIQMGGDLATFIDVVSLLIVVGGTIGAALINYPLKDILSAFAIGMKTFISKPNDPVKIVQTLLELAQMVRQEGLLSMESKVEEIENSFLKRGIQMAIDGQKPKDIDDMLYAETDAISQRHNLGAEIFTTFGSFAPAFGMIGTLIGLVLMLQNMEDPSTIGPSMSVALLTTFYGALIANIVFLPMAGKLRTLSKKEMLINEIIMAGIQALASGENPRVMERRLHGYLPPKNRISIFD